MAKQNSLLHTCRHTQLYRCGDPPRHHLCRRPLILLHGLLHAGPLVRRDLCRPLLERNMDIGAHSSSVAAVRFSPVQGLFSPNPEPDHRSGSEKSLNPNPNLPERFFRSGSGFGEVLNLNRTERRWARVVVDKTDNMYVQHADYIR